jgi:hypothetical protein
MFEPPCICRSNTQGNFDSDTLHGLLLMVCDYREYYSQL